MIPRPLARTRRAAVWLALAFSLTTLAGCDPRQMAYFLQPFEPQIAAPGPSLKGKRVVVVTKAVPGTQNDYVTLDRDLTREFVSILRQKVKKIDVVDPDKVATWAEAHRTWTDPAELAEWFEADLVIFLEVRGFQIESANSPNMFEGARTSIFRSRSWRIPRTTGAGR